MRNGAVKLWERLQEHFCIEANIDTKERFASCGPAWSLAA